MKFCVFLLLISTHCIAQQLVPYQVQDSKNWDRNRLWGYKDKNFNIVIQPINEKPNLFKNGYCVLVKNGKMGLIDIKGNVILQPYYENCSDVESDVVELKDSVLPSKGFYNIESDKPGYFLNIKTNQKAILNDNSNARVKCEMSGINNLFVSRTYDNISKRNFYGLKNFNNEIIYPNIYKEIDIIDEGILRVQTTDGLYGFVNAKGEWLVEPGYNYLGRFEDGVALVNQNNKWGYINNTAKQILPIQYDKAHAFINGYADVTYNNEFFIIDKAGKALFKSDKIRYMEKAMNGIFIVKHINDSSYILNQDGKNLSIGANEIETFDGESFLLLIGKSAYTLYKNSLSKLFIENVESIRSMKMGLFIIYSKDLKDGKEVVTVFNNNGNVIAKQENFLKFREHEDLQLLEAYWQVNVPFPGMIENNYVDYVYSYVTATGKTYSDITK